MKIGIVGGTGAEGSGLALRWGEPRPFLGTSIEVAVLVADRL